MQRLFAEFDCQRVKLELVAKLVAEVVKTIGVRKKTKLLMSSATNNEFLNLVLERFLFVCVSCLVLASQSTRLNAQEKMSDINPDIQAAMPIDSRRVAENGLRTIEGTHVTIYTDVPKADWIEELPRVFDAAVPQWCQYFSEDVKLTKSWKMHAFLIRDKERFRKAGLIPADLPNFPAGLNRGHEIWFMLQPDQYYTRHLFLHEGTHAFMQWFGNGVGAPWYAEGIAELLGLHQWSDGQLKLHYRISNSKESEGWGRPKLIKQWVQNFDKAEAEQERSLQDILLTPNRAFENVESYAWCWAACEFLSQHPLTKDKFGSLQKVVHQTPDEFNLAFQRLFKASMSQLERDWAWFIREMDYGYSVSRGSMTELRPSGMANQYELKTDRSWQVLRMNVRTGDKFRVSASGRFEVGSSVVGDRVKPWPCEANGVTIDYFRGRPLGEFHATILPTSLEKSLLSTICKQPPIAIGLSKVITADVDGLLCFRINESPANLADNRGTLKITIENVD